MKEKFNLIMQEVATDGSVYDEILVKYLGGDIEKKHELISELVLGFSNNRKKVIRSYNEGWFKYLFATSVRNQIKSSTSIFHRNVRQSISEKLSNRIDDIRYNQEISITDIADLELNEKRMQLLSEAKARIKTTWFESEMARLYFDENMSFRDIEREYSIDHCWVWETVQGYKKKLIIEINKISI